MTSEEIKAEFARHPAEAPLMKAFRAWLVNMRNDAAENVCVGSDLPHIEHRKAGRLAESNYALEVFDGVLAEARRAGEEADRAKH